MKKLMLAAIIALSLTACTQPDSAKKALEQSGYTDVKMDGYAVFGCGKDDSFHDKFVAKGPTGQVVSGVVCGGFLKGKTIRID